MKSIESREDIEVLVNTFYDKVRKDDLLGAIFNHHITEDQWPAHLAKLADFWEMILFGNKKFFGSPTQKHIDVDKNLNYTISQEHFGRWIQLWFETINNLYDCELARKAKEASRKMGHAQFMMMFNHRPENIIY